jgi:hypothetical protein
VHLPFVDSNAETFLEELYWIMEMYGTTDLLIHWNTTHGVQSGNASLGIKTINNPAGMTFLPPHAECSIMA